MATRPERQITPKASMARMRQKQNIPLLGCRLNRFLAACTTSNLLCSSTVNKSRRLRDGARCTLLVDVDGIREMLVDVVVVEAVDVAVD